MSADVEGKKRLDLRPRAMTDSASASASETAPTQPSVEPDPQQESEAVKPHDHPLLIDAHEDRWPWRRKIRQDPRKLFFWRIGVALLGLLLLCLAAITGPIPGPGGIPLAILGIAVWSSEFEWAQRLMIWFKTQLKRYLALPRSHRVLFWSTLAVCGLTGAYLVLLTIGVPFWVPEFAANWLRMLPGV